MQLVMEIYLKKKIKNKIIKNPRKKLIKIL